MTRSGGADEIRLPSSATEGFGWGRGYRLRLSSVLSQSASSGSRRYTSRRRSLACSGLSSPCGGRTAGPGRSPPSHSLCWPRCVWRTFSGPEFLAPCLLPGRSWSGWVCWPSRSAQACCTPKPSCQWSVPMAPRNGSPVQSVRVNTRRWLRGPQHSFSPVGRSCWGGAFPHQSQETPNRSKASKANSRSFPSRGSLRFVGKVDGADTSCYVPKSWSFTPYRGRVRWGECWIVCPATNRDTRGATRPGSRGQPKKAEDRGDRGSRKH